jgi:hypothetical protein
MAAVDSDYAFIIDFLLKLHLRALHRRVLDFIHFWLANSGAQAHCTNANGGLHYMRALLSARRSLLGACQGKVVERAVGRNR